MSHIVHHPDENMLAEFAAGQLDWGMALAVSAHIHQCTECAARLREMNQLGGMYLDQAPVQTVSSRALELTLQRIRNERSAQVAVPKQAAKVPADRDLTNLPPMVLKALGPVPKVRWRHVSAALKTARIPLPQSRCEVAFHKICSGGKVPEHDHKGTEVTLVLEGSFSDEKGVYHPGDFLVRAPGEVHRPTAAQNQDCLCLSVLEAPVALTGWLGKIINPWLSFRPG